MDTHTQVRITTHGCEQRHTGNNVSHHISKCAVYEFKTPTGVTSVTNLMSPITTDLPFTPPSPPILALPAAPTLHIPSHKVFFQLHIRHTYHLVGHEELYRQPANATRTISQLASWNANANATTDMAMPATPKMTPGPTAKASRVAKRRRGGQWEGGEPLP